MSWFSRVFRRRGIYAEYAEELRSHLEERTEQLMRDEDLSREEAELRARRAFGNAMLIEERGRETWQWSGLENLLRDLSYSARLLRRSPGFTTVALLTLTLGIGANMAVFSLLNGLLLKPLPVPEANRLVLFRMNSDQVTYAFCAPLFRALERHHEVFSEVYGNYPTDLDMRANGEKLKLSGAMVSGQFFEAMRVPAKLGRTLTAADDRPEGHEAGYPAVISESFWRAKLGADAHVIGRKLVLNDLVFTVVGVMPKSFIGSDATARPEVFLPLTAEEVINAPFSMTKSGAGAWWIRMGARLQPGVTVEKANAAMGSISASAIAASVPQSGSMFKMKWNALRVQVEPGAGGFSMLRTRYRNPLMMIFALCLLVLVLACVNLASLLLARSAAREREIATRLAIGASRSRLMQQLMVDSLLLAFIGCSIGLAVAPVTGSLLTRLFAGKGVAIDASLDWRVVAFAAGCAVVSTMFVGLLPAWQATAGTLLEHMKDGARGSARREHTRMWPKLLLTLEVALAMVLVTGAGLLGTSLYRISHKGLGFDPQNLMEVSFAPDKASPKGEARMSALEEVRARVAAVHGVEQVGYVQIPPLMGTIMFSDMRAPGGHAHDGFGNSLGAGYFAAMRTPVLEGRDFQQNELVEGGHKVIISKAAADLLYPGQSAVGRVVISGEGKNALSETIIGVVEDTKYAALNEERMPTMYSPMHAAKKGDFDPVPVLMVRYRGSAAAVTSAIRQVSLNVAPLMPIAAFSTMDEAVAESSTAQRAMATLAGFFGICALLVTGIGLYGVLAYATARRTGEIGIRMALGAARSNVIGLVFKENAWVAGAGCITGLVAAVLSSKAIASFLYGTSARDPWVLLGSLGLMCLIAFFASLLPALRAASVDPMRALRSE